MSQIQRISRNSDTPPLLIAEISANHGGSLELMKEQISAAAESGADMVKIQTYTAETMTLDCDRQDFQITHGKWKGRSLFALYKSAETPREWHQEIFDYAERIGIEIFSTPFDETAVDFLEQFDLPAYKIASFEMTDTELVKYVAQKKKPVLMSTGMATEREVSSSLSLLRPHLSNDEILLFHCISEYPATLSDSNLSMIQVLRDTFDVNVGLSDHTEGQAAAIVATALGVRAIEKHFTLSRAISSEDGSFSIEPKEFRALKQSVTETYSAVTSRPWVRSGGEQLNMQFRRSLYYGDDLIAGQITDATNIRKIRPGFGLPASAYRDVLGKKLSRDVSRGDPVRLVDFE